MLSPTEGQIQSRSPFRNVFHTTKEEAEAGSRVAGLKRLGGEESKTSVGECERRDAILRK